MKEEVVTALRNAMEFATSDKQAKAMAYVKAIEIYNNFIEQAKVKYPPVGEFVCKKGCSYCCKEIKLAMYPSELFVLLHISQLTLQELKDKVKDGFNGCPFLIDDCCSIEEFKPVKCRGANSYDLEFCKNPPLLYVQDKAPVWLPSRHAANVVHQALGEVYSEKAMPINRTVEEYNG